MTVPYLSQDEFLALLRENGYHVVCDSYFEDYDRIILGKDGHTFPLQLKKTYYYPLVVKTCFSLGIEPPADHLKVYKQHEQMKQRMAEERKNKEQK